MIRRCGGHAWIKRQGRATRIEDFGRARGDRDAPRRQDAWGHGRPSSLPPRRHQQLHRISPGPRRRRSKLFRHRFPRIPNAAGGEKAPERPVLHVLTTDCLCGRTTVMCEFRIGPPASSCPSSTNGNRESPGIRL